MKKYTVSIIDMETSGTVNVYADTASALAESIKYIYKDDKFGCMASIVRIGCNKEVMITSNLEIFTRFLRCLTGDHRFVVECYSCDNEFSALLTVEAVLNEQ